MLHGMCADPTAPPTNPTAPRMASTSSSVARFVTRMTSSPITAPMEIPTTASRKYTIASGEEVVGSISHMSLLGTADMEIDVMALSPRNRDDADHRPSKGTAPPETSLG